MRVGNWVHVLVIRRLFDEGWTTEQVALAYDKIQQATGRVAIAYSMPNGQYVDQRQVADEVYVIVARGD